MRFYFRLGVSSNSSFYLCVHGHVCGGVSLLTCALGGGDQRPGKALVPEKGKQRHKPATKPPSEALAEKLVSKPRDLLVSASPGLELQEVCATIHKGCCSEIRSYSV